MYFFSSPSFSLSLYPSEILNLEAPETAHKIFRGCVDMCFSREFLLFYQVLKSFVTLPPKSRNHSLYEL